MRGRVAAWGQDATGTAPVLLTGINELNAFRLHMIEAAGSQGRQRDNAVKKGNGLTGAAVNRLALVTVV